MYGHPEQIVRRIRRHGGLGLVDWSASSRINSPTRSISLEPLLARHTRVIGGFSSPAAFPCFPRCRPISRPPTTSAGLFAGEAEERRLTKFARSLHRHAPADLQPPCSPLPIAGAPTPYLPMTSLRGSSSTITRVRRRTRLPVPVHLLHHHQRAGRKSRRRSADDVEQLVRGYWPQRVNRFFITDDNFARNKDWEAIFDRLIVACENATAFTSSCVPGRYDVSQAAGLHRQGDARAAHSGLYRHCDRQSRQPHRREETAEQDHRIPRRCCSNVAYAGVHHLRRLHSGLPRRYAGGDPPRTSS